MVNLKDGSPTFSSYTGAGGDKITVDDKSCKSPQQSQSQLGKTLRQPNAKLSQGFAISPHQTRQVGTIFKQKQKSQNPLIINEFAKTLPLKDDHEI